MCKGVDWTGLDWLISLVAVSCDHESEYIVQPSKYLFVNMGLTHANSYITQKRNRKH
jgi:hypothetical protein